MKWLIENVEWVFSGIGVYIVSIFVISLTYFFFRKKINATVSKISKVFVVGWRNNTNVNQNDEK